MAFTNTQGRTQTSLAEMNIVPLVDVVLVLLIIFMPTAPIRAVAPGIADSLIATAAGLFAAIPAVIAYNYFIHQIKEFGAAMDDFTLEFLNLMERTFS